MFGRLSLAFGVFLVALFAVSEAHAIPTCTGNPDCASTPGTPICKAGPPPPPGDPSGLPACSTTAVNGTSCDCAGTTGATCGRVCNPSAPCELIGRAGKVADFHCTQNTCTSYCAPGATCNVHCSTSADCVVDCAAGSICNTDCSNAKDCTVFCEPGATCTQTFSSTTARVSCPSGATCVNNQCSSTTCQTACGAASCTNAGNCTSCSDVGTIGICVQCLSNADCGGNTPICNPSGTCVGCTDDSQCTDPNSPVCQLTGPLAGSCTPCSATEAGKCVQPTPVCLPGTGTCGCTTDTDCGGSTSGLICTGQPPSCVPGCRTDAMGNTCPVGQTCVTTGMGDVGTCTSGCQKSGDCVAPTGACKLPGDGGVGSCVPCVDNGDCTTNPAGPLCGPNNTCGQCTPTNTTNCDPNGTGGACRPNGQCGCNTDTDCAMGKVCDDTHVCRAGCRGTGANGCATGQICTTCVAPDGGVPDAGLDSGVVDAGPAVDSGSPKPFDAGPFNQDSGSGKLADDVSIEGGGCNCSTPGALGDASPWVLGGIAACALTLVARRRNVRRRRDR